MLRTLVIWTLAVPAVALPQAPAQSPTPPAPAAPPEQAGPAEQAAPADAARQDLKTLLADEDATYERRDAPGALDELRQRLEAAEKLAPDDYGVLWRQARLYYWLADDPAISDDQKSKLGKTGWDYGERAIRADPGRVEGWFFSAAGMGNYGLGIGILKALTQGIEGKFKDRLSHAEKLDPAFQGGGVQVAWGRFWFKLPWPKYDGEKSERALLAALARNRDNVRARVYLADLYEKEGHGKEARAQLEKAAAGEPGRYDAPEERRWQAVARSRIARR